MVVLMPFQSKSDAEFVERLQRLGCGRIGVLLQKRVVERPDDFAGLNGNLEFSTGNFLHLRIDEKGQARILPRQNC